NLALDVFNDWTELDTSRGFSPDDLHGAPGSLKFGSFGVIIGGTIIRGSARLKGTRDYLFEDAELNESGLDIGVSLGYVRGQWMFDNVWSKSETPAYQGQVTESVGAG